MNFDVEIVLRERNYAVTERMHHAGIARDWTEHDVETVLKEILLAIDRVKNPATRESLRGAARLQLDRRANRRGRGHRDRDPDGRGGRRPVRHRTGASRSHDHACPDRRVSGPHRRALSRSSVRPIRTGIRLHSSPVGYEIAGGRCLPSSDKPLVFGGFPAHPFRHCLCLRIVRGEVGRRSAGDTMKLPFRVLVLDDDENALCGIVELLRAADHDVTDVVDLRRRESASRRVTWDSSSLTSA